MDDQTRRQLSALASLKVANLSALTIPCKVCGMAAQYFDACDFNKCPSGHPFGHSGIEVRWFQCRGCGFLFTPFFDDWQSGDFARFVYNDDYALIDPEYAEIRPTGTAEMLAGGLHDAKDLRVLDYGSGAGVMAKRMLELGFTDTANYDPFSSPGRPSGKFDVVTCFEAIEHSPDPIGTIRDMMEFMWGEGSCIILGETLQPADIEQRKAGWWYCAPRSGHCSIFTEDALAVLAAKFGLIFYQGAHVHGLCLGDLERVHAIAHRFGQPLLSWMVYAPADPVVPGWHEREHAFRWTASPRLNWTTTMPRNIRGQPTVRVQLPIAMEGRANFISECRVEINGFPANLEMKSGRLFAEVSNIPSSADLEVVLLTPAPRSPAELGSGPDRRALGLAILCAPSKAPL